MLIEELCLSVQGLHHPNQHFEVTQCPVSCPEDINGDGEVNVSDLLAIIAAWGIYP